MAETNNDPWWPIGLGALAVVIGVILAAAAISADRADGVKWVGFGLIGLGSTVLLVGLIALGVAIGIRSARD